MTEKQKKGLSDLLDHFQGFDSAVLRLMWKLIEAGQTHLAQMLLYNSRQHDLSKIVGVEWDCLVMGERPELLKTAVEQHNRSNQHHPEYFGSIHDMDDVHIAEMVCDWKSRSAKFGTGLREWIHNEAMDRYHFSKGDPVYEKIMRFVAMILDEPYKMV
jgi:hypothetical protein